MKLNGNPIQELEIFNEELSNYLEIIGDNHIASSLDTPLRPDAFFLSDEEKIDKIRLSF